MKGRHLHPGHLDSYQFNSISEATYAPAQGAFQFKNDNSLPQVSIYKTIDFTPLRGRDPFWWGLRVEYLTPHLGFIIESILEDNHSISEATREFNRGLTSLHFGKSLCSGNSSPSYREISIHQLEFLLLDFTQPRVRTPDYMPRLELF